MNACAACAAACLESADCRGDGDDGSSLNRNFAFVVAALVLGLAAAVGFLACACGWSQEFCGALCCVKNVALNDLGG